MKLDLRRWLIVVLGAGLPIPYAFHPPGDSSSYVAINLLIWPVVAGGLVLTGHLERARLQRDLVARLLLAFVVISAVTVPFGLLTYHRWSGPVSFSYQVLILLNFVVGYLVLRGLEDIELLIRAFVASIGAVALPLAIYLLYAGSLEKVHLVHNSSALRSFVYGWPNGFAVLLAVSFVMCLYVISTAGNRLVRRIYVLLGIALGACLILTFSKTGWVAVVLALWLLYLRFWTVRRQLLLLAGAVLSGTVLLFAHDLRRTAIDFVSNESFRMQVFTLDTLLERFRFLLVVLRDVNLLTIITGSGSQSVETLLASHAHDQLIPGVTVGSLSTHDEFLNILVKSGLIGLVVFVTALVLVMLRSRQLAYSTKSRDAQLFRYWYAASWAVVVSLFAGEELHYWLVGALFWLMAGAMLNRTPAVAAEPSRPGETAKRILDVTAGALGLVVTSPLLLVAAILVKVDSPGPVIYAGRRVGWGGRVFAMYKLRTMTVGADGGGSVTVAGDMRVTRVGRALRKLKLDELPQLVNVLKGDMSLVGPRPDTPDYVALYNQRQRGVLRVRPGITSPASISFHNEEDLLVAATADGRRTPAEVYREEIMPRELEIDLEYVENWSFGRDLQILLQTVALVLRRLLGLPRELRHPLGSGLAPSQPKVEQPLKKADPVADVITGEGHGEDR